jgi:D-alanyl-D-alanine endopeptidase (penicillin-binding protein 7)
MLLGVAAPTPALAGGRKGKATASVPALTPDGLPNVQAGSAAVIDAATGEVLYGKAMDQVRPIASTTKIFVAMAVRRRGLDLDGITEITREDARYGRGGATTHLDIRVRFKNLDLLRAMLIASDNRAPSALGRAVGLSVEELVADMNAQAVRLGLKHTRFNHPNGLGGNESTAREMALALREAMKDPLLAEIMSTPTVEIQSAERRPVHIRYVNTNGALHAKKYQVTGGKTGFTDAAGYCLVIAAHLGARDVTMAFLGAQGKLTRFADFNRVAGWLTPAAGATTAAATASPQP